MHIKLLYTASTVCLLLTGTKWVRPGIVQKCDFLPSDKVPYRSLSTTNFLSIYFEPNLILILFFDWTSIEFVSLQRDAIFEFLENNDQKGRFRFSCQIRNNGVIKAYRLFLMKKLTTSRRALKYERGLRRNSDLTNFGFRYPWDGLHGGDQLGCSERGVVGY